MKFDAAADLLAAMKPFVRTDMEPRLDGLERLVRTSTHLRGQLHAVRDVLPPPRCRASRRLLATGNPSDPGAPEAADEGSLAVAALPPEEDEAGGLEAASQPDPPRAERGTPLLFLLLLLLLAR